MQVKDLYMNIAWTPLLSTLTFDKNKSQLQHNRQGPLWQEFDKITKYKKLLSLSYVIKEGAAIEKRNGSSPSNPLLSLFIACVIVLKFLDKDLYRLNLNLNQPTLK